MKGYLSDKSLLTQLTTVTAGAAGTTAITSAAVDMAGYDGCLFLVSFGAIVSGAATSIKVQQSSDDGSSDTYDDLTGTGQTVGDTADDTTFAVDVKQPGKRYLKLVVSRATQNATVGSILAIRYQKRTVGGAGISQGVTLEQWTSPAEGTA